MSSPQIRFDDLRPRHRRGFALTDIEQLLVATRLDEVRTVLAEAEAQVAAGKWVGGWISYEAAPAFDPVLQVIDPTETAFEGLPLVWLAVSRRRHHPTPATASGDHRLGEWESLTSEEEHRDALAAIRRRIEAGDTYQVNHTFLLQAEFSGDPAAFYQRLVRSQ